MKKQLIAALIAFIAFTIGILCIATGDKITAAPTIAAAITAAIALKFI